MPISRFKRWCWDWLFRGFMAISPHYCKWAGIPYWGAPTFPLPFGLLVKANGRVRTEELLAMRLAKAAGLPVPTVYCFGTWDFSFPGYPTEIDHGILMRRMPGKPLGEVYDSLSSEALATIKDELRGYFKIMHSLNNPFGENRICSVAGTKIFGHTLPGAFIGPCDDESAFHATLRESCTPDGMGQSGKPYDDALCDFELIYDMPHRVVFTHGDLWHHNILIHDGHVSGIVDWETAGWLPEYWECTTVLRYQLSDSWWSLFVHDLFQDRYRAELVSARGLWNLTQRTLCY